MTRLSESGEIWCAPNPLVRLESNWTMGRKTTAAAPDSMMRLAGNA